MKKPGIEANDEIVSGQTDFITHGNTIYRSISLPCMWQRNTIDPFYQFNDSTFHVECLRKHILGYRPVEFANQFILKTRPENRICIVGGNLIRNFDDCIFIDLLTSNEKEGLYKFNFTTLDRRNLEEWNDRSRFVTDATKFKNDGKWRDLSSYKHLDNLIERTSG